MPETKPSLELKELDPTEAIRREFARINQLDQNDPHMQDVIEAHRLSEIKLGRQAEEQLIMALGPLFKAVEKTPVSIDKIRSSSQIDILVLLPSGRPLAIQHFVSKPSMPNWAITMLTEKYQQAVNHGVAPLKRMGRPILQQLPMPIAAVPIDENLFHENNQGEIVRSFLIQTIASLDPTARRQIPGKNTLSPGSNEWNTLESYRQELRQILEKIKTGTA